MPLRCRRTGNKMETIKHFIFAGCSHTNGSEIEHKWHPGTPEKAYGAYVATAFDASWENISGPGWSNQWIFIQLMKRLGHLTENEIKNTVISIAWTSSERLPIWNPEHESYFHATPSIRHFPNKFVKKAHGIIYKTCLRKKEFELLEQSMIIGMQHTLKNIGVSYIMHWAVCPISASNHLNAMLDKNYFIDFYDRQNSFWNTYLNNYWDHSDRWSNHAPESYHKIYADKIINYLNGLNNV